MDLPGEPFAFVRGALALVRLGQPLLGALQFGGQPAGPLVARAG